MRILTPKYLGLLPAALWSVAVGVLSLLPGKSLPALTFWDLVAPDKAEHLTVYALMVAAWLGGLGNTRSWLQVVGICTAYGIALEWAQWLFTDRLYEYADMAANAAGCLVGAGVASVYYSWVLRRRA